MKDRERLVERVKAVMAKHGHNTRDLSCLLNLGKAPVERFVNGERAGELVQASMREYLARAERGDFRTSTRGADVVAINQQPRRAVITRERPRQHYDTPFVRRVGSLIDLAMENCSIVIGLAEFGAGKTYAAQAWRSRHGHDGSVLFEFDPFTSRHNLAFLQAFAAAVGVSESRVTVHNSYEVWQAIVGALQQRQRVLIFDQCEAVRVRILQYIRHIWDATGCPVVILAAPTLGQRLDRGRSGDLGALRSRIACWEELYGLTAADTAAVLKREGVGAVDPATVQLLHEAVNGSMRYLLEAVDLLVSRHKGKAVGEKTIRGVCRRLMGIRMRVEAAMRLESREADIVGRAITLAAEEARDAKGGV